VYKLLIENETLPIYLTDVEVTSEDLPGWLVAVKGTVTVALDVTITADLLNEGNAREFVNRIQKLRKESGFELTDRILVEVAGAGELEKSITAFKTYICSEILADELIFQPEINGGTEIDVNELLIHVKVSKKGG
jgi:isoleucyl-tRNA synthetase